MLDRVDVRVSVLQLVRRFTPALPASDEEAERAALADAGLTSMAAVRLMLALEAQFAIAIPDADLTAENFAGVEAIVALVDRLVRR